ncbi:unnamed protein product [Brassica rapa subsp. narinosa]
MKKKIGFFVWTHPVWIHHISFWHKSTHFRNTNILRKVQFSLLAMNTLLRNLKGQIPSIDLSLTLNTVAGERTSCRREDASSNPGDIESVKKKLYVAKLWVRNFKKFKSSIMPMSMDPYGGEFQGTVGRSSKGRFSKSFGKPCTKSKYSSKYSSGSGFKLITDGVIFHGKNSPRSYNKGYIPSQASHVMIPTLSVSSVFSLQVSADQRERLAMFMEWLDQSRDLIRESRKTMMETKNHNLSDIKFSAVVEKHWIRH